MKKLNAIISALMFSFLFASCGGSSQIEEANRLVSAANENIVEANELVKKAERKNKKLFAVSIQTDEELKNYKRQMSAEAKAIIEDFEKAADLAEIASHQFAEAGNLNVPEDFRKYLETKSHEFAKRAEAVETRKENARAFLEYDDATMVKKFEENNEQAEKLMREAEELEDKAEEIQKEN